MATKYSILIVEDDEFSVALLERNLSFFDTASINHVSTTVKDAIAFLSVNSPDIIFLDIELPDGKGFEIIPFISGNPTVVVLTGDEGYAFTAFENGVFDFLKKPFTPARFRTCMDRIEQTQSKRNILTENDNAILFVKSGVKHVKINLDELLYAEAVNDYAKLHLQNGKELLINLSLKELMQKIHGLTFLQVHRSFLINMQQIDLVENDTIKIKGSEIPIGKTYRPAFQKVLNS
jgi:two-component system, LytTR family, response regulator